MGDVVLGGDVIPELSLALPKSLLSSVFHCIIACRARAVLDAAPRAVKRG